MAARRTAPARESRQSAPEPPPVPPASPAPDPSPGPVPIRWDDRNLQSVYANACNVVSTREEVVLLLGLNQAWRRGQREIPVQLSNRIVLHPIAAKRVSLLLESVLREYESRFGSLA